MGVSVSVSGDGIYLGIAASNAARGTVGRTLVLLVLSLHCFVGSLIDSGAGVERRSGQGLDQVGSILGLHHPQRTLAEVLQRESCN